MKFKTINVAMPKHDADVVLTFPGGEKVTIQARPSNADMGYNGSLDIILPDDQAVTCWKGDDMEAAPVAYRKGPAHIRLTKQLCCELPGKGY